jgi:hypothetical protein
MLRDKIIAAARTGFAVLGAAIVTWVVTMLADLGVVVKVDETWSTVLAGAMFAVFVGLYNFVVQWATENVWDGFGWLLGVNKAPAYVDADLRTEPEGAAVDESALPNVSGGTPWSEYETGDPHR